MTNCFLRVITMTALVLGLGSSIAGAQSASLGGVPPMPAKLEVPAGNTFFFKAHAVGTQNYVCLPNGSAFAWRFIAPEATLFHTFFGQFHQQLATHFLSPNPDEAQVPRATWQHSLDSSRVWARMDEQSSDSAFVEAGAIPWFRLVAVGNEVGPEGGFLLSQTTYIQRLNTHGGIAPPTGCAQSTDLGAIVLVPYAADYFFYRKSGR